MDFAGGIPFESLPEELQQMLRASVEAYTKRSDLMQMGITDSRHRLMDWFESLDEEGILCMRTLIMLASAGPPQAAYYMGLTAQYLTQFGYCKVCHEKHDTDVEGVDMTKTAPEPETSVLQQPGRVMDLMNEYGVAPNGNGDQVECINCGYVNVSLQDRMLREPGVPGCDGCRHKQKWG